MPGGDHGLNLPLVAFLKEVHPRPLVLEISLFGLFNFLVFHPYKEGFDYQIVLYLFLTIWMNDTGAYITGRLIGKHKMFPRISPKKSWEGLIGGAIFAVIMAIVNSFLFLEHSITSWIVIALLIVIFGTSGDFFESKLKREAGVKDSGSILPGHGGMLDRFDTMLFAVPVIFVWINLFGNI